MAKAVILHTIEDVKHCLKHGLHKDAKLFSANVNVFYYLKYEHGVECANLCSYIGTEEYLRIHELAREISKSVLSELDQQIVPQLNQVTGLSIKYFEPLYSFAGALQLALYMLLTRFLTCMLRQGQWDGALIYDGVLGILNGRIEDFLAKMFPEADFQIVSYKSSSPAVNTQISNIGFRDISHLLRQYDCGTIPNLSLSQQGIDGKHVLVFEPMTMLSSIQTAAKSTIYAFNPWIPLPDSPKQFAIGYHNLPTDHCLQSIRMAKENVKGMVSLLYQTVKEDFCRHIVQYLQVVHACKRMHEENPIQHVYWENPPYRGVGALVLEYFMTNQATQVVGVQTIGTFYVGQFTTPAYSVVHGIQRCQYYFSQGATQADVDDLFPEVVGNIVVIPPMVAEVSNTAKLHEKIPVDAAIYLDWTWSFNSTGTIAANVGLQEALLTFLETQQDKIIHIVAPKNASVGACAMLSKLNLLTNVKLIESAGIDAYINQYTPKVIVLTSLMSCVGDILCKDISVIMLKDAQIKFKAQVLDLLKQRIYYAEDLAETERLLQMSFAGKLDKKSDTAYGRNFWDHAGLRETLVMFHKADCMGNWRSV